ncbi:MAG: PAS domain-containing protein [Anaerolineae bacterium]|nr:PAS domain-containing protein [Anaerolineae bacterium]
MPPSPLHILHVDDSVLDRELVRDVLERESDQFVVTAAASRQEFEIQLTKTNYDAVLTDFNILGFEGLQVIDAVYKVTPSLPVILVTGTGSEEVAVEAMKRGAVDYVIKSPKHIRRLPLVILAAVEHKRLQDEQLLSEQALRTSEERLSAFAKALPDLAFIVDGNGHFVRLLSGADHHLYREGQHLLGKCIRDVMPAHAAQQLLNAIHRTIATTTTQSVEYQIESSDNVKWFEARISPMQPMYDEKSMVAYIVRDITDRKMGEIKLKRERNLLRTLIDNVPDYIFVKDRSGRFIASNTPHSAAIHRTPAQVIDKTDQDLQSPDFVQQFHNDDEELMLTGVPLINQERLIHNAQGRSQWLLMTKVPLRNELGDVIGLVGISRDITDRRQAEELLRASEAHLRAVVSGTPVILFEVDTNGVVTFLQGRGVNIFGGDPNIFLGKSIFETFGEFVPNIKERFQSVLNGEEASTIQTLGDIILDVRYSPLKNNLGEIKGIIGVANDITERLNAEKLRIELEKEQEMIALKERFIATASHDFRTPLTIIKMSIHMLETYLDRMSVEQRTAKLHQIHTEVDHMTQLLDDVLTMSKANAGKLDFKPKSVALKPFCEQILDSFRSMAEKTHEVEFVYNYHYEEAHFDPNLIHYALVNLLSNAFKYSPHNGHVCLKVENDQNHLIFRVSDDGIGIPEIDQANLFQPFHRATNTRGIEGTGLGLSIVKSYVELHRGTISVQSKEDEGTVFTVSIPLK